jgi:hypothetical protein
MSGGAALAVAAVFTRLLRQFPNALGLTLNLDLGIEWHALACCLALSAAAVLLFGLAPALETARLAIMPALKDSGNASTGGRGRWFRGALVAVQAALAMILLVGGGLYGRALWKIYSTDLGFRSDHLLIADFSLPPSGKDAAGDAWRAQRLLLDRLLTIPGVVSATFSSTAILSPGRPKTRIETGPGSAPVFAACEYVGRDFFRTMGIPLYEGQDYTARDEQPIRGTPRSGKRPSRTCIWRRTRPKQSAGFSRCGPLSLRPNSPSRSASCGPSFRRPRRSTTSKRARRA